MKHRLLVTVPALISAMVLSASAAVAAPTAKVDRGLASAGGCTQGAAMYDPALKPSTTSHTDRGKHLGQTKHDQTATEDESDDSDNEEVNGDRPHNHGWFVSEAAKDHSTTGRAHGEAVSAVARGDDGKPDQASH